MHKIYFNKCKEADIAEALVVRAQHDNNLSKKDLAKLEDNARKEKKKASIAAHDYKSAINEYEMIRLQWEEDMEAACRVKI